MIHASEGIMTMKMRVNLSIDETMLAEARALGLNLSALAEQAIGAAAREARNARWRADHAEGLAAWATAAEDKPLPLEGERLF